MDISDTLAPKSDQLDAVDLLAGPRIFTVERVSKGNAEQPVQIHLTEFPRPWRPGVSMRRVLAACWGPEASQWTGHRVELYCDTRVKFGADEVGGTRISALSHIDKPRKIPLLVSKGRSAVFKVEPLKDSAPTPRAVSDDTLAELESLFKQAGIPDEQRLPGIAHIIGGSVSSIDALTEDQAQTVLSALRKKIGR